MVAYAPIIQAMSGMMSLVGYPPEENEPLVGELQAAWSDTVAALCAALGVVAALRHRNRTGCGQYVEAAHLEGTAALLGVPMLQYQMSGQVPTPPGNDDPDFAPHNNYPCAGDDAWVSIAVGDDAEWHALNASSGTVWPTMPALPTRIPLAKPPRPGRTHRRLDAHG